MTSRKALEFSFVTALGNLDKGKYVNSPIYWINTCMKTILWKNMIVIFLECDNMNVINM